MPRQLVIIKDIAHRTYFISVGQHRAGLGQSFDVRKFYVIGIAGLEQVNALQEVESDKECGDSHSAGQADFNFFRKVFHKFLNVYLFFLYSEMASESSIFWPFLKATIKAPSKSSFTLLRILMASW